MDDSFNVHFQNFSTPLQNNMNKSEFIPSFRRIQKKNGASCRLRGKTITNKLLLRPNDLDTCIEEESSTKLEYSQDFLPSNQVEFINYNAVQTDEVYVPTIVNDVKEKLPTNISDLNHQPSLCTQSMMKIAENKLLDEKCNFLSVSSDEIDIDHNRENISQLVSTTGFSSDIYSTSIFNASMFSKNKIKVPKSLKVMDTTNASIINDHLNDTTVYTSDDHMKQVEDVVNISDFDKSITQNIVVDKHKPNKKMNLVRKTEFNTHNIRGSFYDLPISVKLLIEQYKGITDFYEWQKECLQLPAVIKRHNLIYALPTSGGKTLVAEILMLREIVCRNKNVLFVLPFVAIVQEKVWSLSPFAINLNFLVEEYAAGKGVYPPKKRRKKKSIYVATLEKGLGIVRSLLELNRLEELGLVVVDELHLIGDSSRGHILETMLTNIIYNQADIQIIGMSATIGNIDELASFLGAFVYTQDFRPVELKEYVKNNDVLLSVNYKNDEIFTVAKKVTFGYSSQVTKVDPDHLGGLVMEVIPKSSCLIFCPTKKNCENVAELLCKVIFKQLLQHRVQEKDNLLRLLTFDSGDSLCPILQQTIPWGVAYHHSGLTSEERRLLEEAFRSGIISVLCCTSTLAAGVNLPAQRVILRSPIVGREFMSLSTYKQMVGRAGRAGFGCCGESIVICPNVHLQKLKELLESPMDEAISVLHNNESSKLKMLFLNAVILRLANDVQSLTELLKSTLLGVQADRLQLDLGQITAETIENLVELKALYYVNVDAPLSKDDLVEYTLKVGVTKLGKAAIKGCIDIQRAQVLYNDLKKAQKGLVLTGILHLLYLVTPYELATSVQPNMTSYYSILIDLDEEGCDTAKCIGIKQTCAIHMATGVKPQGVSELILNRFYVALLLRDLWNQESITTVSARYQVNKGTVQSIMTSAASFSSNVLRFCEEFEEFWAFSDLLVNFTRRLAYCCTTELLPLMDLPNVKKGRAVQLYKAGYKTLQQIAKASIQDLTESIEHLTKNTACQIIDAAKLLLMEKIENLKDEAEDVLEDLGIS